MSDSTFQFSVVACSCCGHIDEGSFSLIPEMQTSMSVLITMEAVIMTAPTPQAAIPVSAIQGMSCKTLKSVCVSSRNEIQTSCLHIKHIIKACIHIIHVD